MTASGGSRARGNMSETDIIDNVNYTLVLELQESRGEQRKGSIRHML